jgi:peptidase YpeB-like protein
MIKLRTASALAVGAVAALAIGGTALAAGADDPTPSPSVTDDLLPNGDVSPSADPSPSVTDVPRGSVLSVGIDAAKAIAIRAAGGGRVTSIERETEHGRAVWNVDVLIGGVDHDFDIDLATGAVSRHRAGGAARAATPTSTRSHTAHDRNDDHGRNRGGDDANDDHGGKGHGSDDKGGHGSDD